MKEIYMGWASSQSDRESERPGNPVWKNITYGPVEREREKKTLESCRSNWIGSGGVIHTHVASLLRKKGRPSDRHHTMKPHKCLKNK